MRMTSSNPELEDGAGAFGHRPAAGAGRIGVFAGVRHQLGDDHADRHRLIESKASTRESNETVRRAKAELKSGYDEKGGGIAS